MDGDATLIQWTKEISVKDTIGKKIGNMIIDHLSEGEHPVKCSKVVVVNDTKGNDLYIEGIRKYSK